MGLRKSKEKREKVKGEKRGVGRKDWCFHIITKLFNIFSTINSIYTNFIPFKLFNSCQTPFFLSYLVKWLFSLQRNLVAGPFPLYALQYLVTRPFPLQKNKTTTLCKHNATFSLLFFFIRRLGWNQCSGEDPDPVGSIDFWPAGSGTFLPDPTFNNG